MKNGIITVVISGLLIMSLFTAARPGELAAQPDDCGYGQRHCLTTEECVDFGGGWFEPVVKWVFGLVMDACVEDFYYYR